jgi:ABC-2 type transport system permease protein
VLALTVANLKMMFRNRQTAFWALLFPLILVVIFGLYDSKSVGSANLLVLDLDHGASSQLLREKLANVEFLELEPGEGMEAEAREQVADGDLDYLVVIPAGFSLGGAQSGTPGPAPVTLVYSSRSPERNQLVDGLVRSLVGETQPPGPAGIGAPPSQLVAAEIIEVPESDYFDGVLMGLVGLGIMTSSIISIAVRISTYRNQSILKRLLVTPLPIWKFFAGEIAANLVLAGVQAAAILGVGVFAFGAHINGNVGWIIVIALLGSLVFLNIGFIMSAWARTPAAASGMGNAIALPMMFFAGTFFSTATLPWVLPDLARALPLTPMLLALREVSIDSAALWDTWPHLGAMGLWAAATALIATRVFRFS